MPPATPRPLPDDAPELIRALAREAEAHPLDRKLLVAPAAGAGREVLRTLARMRGGWTGFDVTTIRPLAAATAVPLLAAEGLRVLDGFEEEARLDTALDEALDHPEHRAAFGELAEGTGFRRAVRDALAALRLTGLGADAVEAAGFEDRRKQFFLAAVLRGYETALRRDGVLDVGGVLERAAAALGRGAPLPASRILLMPGLGLRGRAGRFVQALERRGAVHLTTDPVLGLAPPPGLSWAPGPERSPLSRLHAPPAATAAAPGAGAGAAPAPASASAPEAGLDGGPLAGLPLFEQVPSPPTAAPAPLPSLHLFRAAGVHEELREVLGRILATGRRWDEAEIVTPEPGVYGPALHTLCSRLGIETTFAVGLPVGRTRPGRVVSAYLRWISDDFPAPVLRRLLQAGDLVAPGGREAESPHLARTLRRLRVGWGRERYRTLVAAAIRRHQEADPETVRHGTPEQARERAEREVRTLQTLDRLLRTVLSATPDARGPTSAGAVAAGVATLLRLVPVESEVDRSAHDRLLRLVDRMAHTLRRETRFSTAVATVREHLEIRVPAPRAEGKAPWLSDGGALHLSDLEHGGLAGRPLLFVVGMDAGRFPGGDRQDPFLLDRERRSLPGDLPVTEDRIREQRFRLAALLARTRGDVTVSYPAWEASEGRVLQPSSVLLTLLRLREGDPGLGYADLERHLSAPVSRIPRHRPPVDAEDVWLGSLVDEARLRDGRDALRARHPRLDRGLTAAEAPFDPEPSSHVGILASSPARMDRLDPRAASGPTLSASALESLGGCPLRYFYSRVLRVTKPDDPDFDLERWLPAAERGSLLHDVFQAAVETARDDDLPFVAPAFRDAAFAALDRHASLMRGQLPPPSEAVFQAEMLELRDDVRSFCAHLAAEGLAPADILATELDLGGDAPVTLPLPGGGALRIRGRIDRVDRRPDGLRIVDYKTGRPWGHGRAEGTYHGGRRLQHVLYARGVEAQLPEEPPVARVEYHFPTVKGQNETHPYEAPRLADGLELVAALVALPAAARFPATDDPSDCRFCDYREVCRFGTVGEGSDASAPRVEWTRARLAEGHESVAGLAAVRRHEDG